jgi:hypothetical protein
MNSLFFAGKKMVVPQPGTPGFDLNVKNMKSLVSLSIAVLLASILMFSCKKDSLRTCEEHVTADCDSIDSTKVNIRIQNISEYNICNLEVNVCCGVVNHGILTPQEVTCYRAYDSAYTSLNLHFWVDNHEFTWDPGSHLGDPQLASGQYTLQLNVTNLQAEQLRVIYVLDTI